MTIVDDYGHHPTELAATIAAVRERIPGGGCACSSSRTSTRARGTRRELGAALAAADDVAVTDIYAAREQPLPGVTASWSSTRSSDRGRARGLDARRWTRASTLVGRAPSGDVLLTIGAGDVDRAACRSSRERLRTALGGERAARPRARRVIAASVGREDSDEWRLRR